MLSYLIFANFSSIVLYYNIPKGMSKSGEEALKALTLSQIINISVIGVIFSILITLLLTYYKNIKEYINFIVLTGLTLAMAGSAYDLKTISITIPGPLPLELYHFFLVRENFLLIITIML